MKKSSLLHLDDPRRIRFLFFLITLFLATPVLTYAQFSVTGKVTDETGAGMPGVNILVKNTTTGTTSDVNGDYTINVGDANSILVFSFIGYNTMEQPVNSQSVINISLAQNVRSLEEVVVVGYGVQKKSDVTGALVSVKSDELKEVPAPNLQLALQGRAAGVEIQRVGTAPGSGARIRVRGERSLNGSNDPLIVLDGIPYDGNLNDINQDEIASIDILKDASATAIYGSRGANGVVIISTKRGKAGDTRLTYDGYYGITTVARKYQLYNVEEYAELRDRSTWTQGYMPEEIEGLKIGRQTDWQDLMYEDGMITNHNLAVSGGSEKNQFSLGTGYFKETTILPGQDFTRYSLRGTVDTKVGERLKIGFNTLNSVNISNGTQFVNQQANTPGAFGGSIMYPILALSPLMPAYNDDGTIYQRPAGNLDDQFGQYNPLLLKDNQNDWTDRIRRLRTFNSLYAEFQIIEALKYRLNAGLDYSQVNSAQFQGQDTYFRTNNQNNRARVRNEETYGYTLENILTYDKTFLDKHRVTFTGLFSAQESHSYNTQVTKDSINADFIEFYDLGQSSSSAPVVLAGGEESWGILSYMARINYAYQDRYLLTLTYRRDGTSRLVDKWHQYPAIAVGWNIKNESFMDNIGVFTNLKLRAGWGETSNQSVRPYASLGGVSANNQTVPIKYNYGSTKGSGYLLTSIPDQTLGWEYTRTVNIGLDFGLFQDRITGSVEWYKADTRDVLFNLNLPAHAGYQDAYQTNIGSMENKGVEVTLSTVNIKTSGGFVWSTDLNWFVNRNELSEIGNGIQRNIANGLHVGSPLTAIYDYKKLGIWQLDEADEAAKYGQVPGQLKIADISGPDGVPDGNITPEYDRSVIGSGQARWQGGMTNRFEYKGFDLSIVAFMRKGGLLISGLHQPNGAYLTNLDGRRNQLKVDYWTPENPTNDFPQPAATITPPNATSAWTTLGYYDASFLKIRSINLGYRIPGSVLDRIKVRSARIYLTAQNPFLLFSPYVKDHNGVDPEATGQGQDGLVSSGGNVRTTGPNQALIIAASTPPTRSFIFGINLGF